MGQVKEMKSSSWKTVFRHCPDGRWLGIVAVLIFAASVAHAEALQVHYSGSSMASDSSGRVITLEFTKDGTGMYQEHSGKKSIDTQMHWSRQGKKVTVVVKPEDGKEADAPLIFELKHKFLVPEGAKESQLGVFAFPTLHPFGPETVGTSSGMTTCVTGAPGPCAMRETWSSKQ
jgi:hypothetical protein